MRMPYCIGVWKPSISKASEWVSDNLLGENVIQFVPDHQGSVWIMLRVTGDQAQVIQAQPRIRVI